MGEAKQRELLGLPPKNMKPNEPMQITVNLKDADRKPCECGCNYFIPVVELYMVSALVSPNGKESLVQRPVLVCLKCQMPFKVKEGA